MRKFLVLLFLSLSSVWNYSYSQACLSNFKYRVQVTLTNTNPTPLTFFQVKVIVDTRTLISASKMRLDGGDIRFTNASGSLLTYWYNPVTFNTGATEFWVKADAVPASSSANIFLFYGNSTSPAVTSGDATFELFDDFDGTAVNGTKWTQCGNIANVSLSGGIATFSSDNTNKDGIIFSNQTFSGNVITEADVISASNGQALLGLTDNTEKGYATTMEFSSTLNVMKVTTLNTGGALCQTTSEILSPSPAPAGSLAGVWSFVWPAASTQIITWPGGTMTYSDATNVIPFTSSKQVLLGSHINTSTTNGSFSVNWLRVRKYMPSDPSFVLGSEVEFPVTANPTNDGPYCGGSTIHFNSNVYAGAAYTWTFHGTVFSNVSQDSITASSPANSGTYTVSIAAPGCPPVVGTTVVNVSQTSVAGITTGNSTTCSGANSGVIHVSGYTGKVIRWEMANSATGPWFTVSNTTDSLNYANLIQTTHFRPVVKTTYCPEAIGAASTITIDNPTVAGFVTGGSSVCYHVNSGTLTLVYSTGNVNSWQKSTDNGTTWTTIITNSKTFNFLNLDSTTLYRAVVQNGTCPVLFSASTTVTVNPLPVPSFHAAAVCQGLTTQFLNASTIPSGTISNYQWDFGNGSSSITPGPVYEYSTAGIYFVTLTAVSSAGCSASVSHNDTVNPLPSVSFTAPPACQGSATSFHAIVSVSNGGSAAAYFWDHANGTTATAPIHSYTYPASGAYNVLLKVTTDKGCIDSVRKNVQVNAPVNVSFNCDSVCIGSSILFVNTSTTSSTTVAYSWDFGNGANSALSNPVYTYPSPGTYSVTLQAQMTGSGLSCNSSLQKVVVIYPMPVPAFTTNNVCSHDSARFSNGSLYTGNPADLSYVWNFGDAGASSITNPAHLYITAGSYTVTLTANTTKGCDASVIKLITIYPMPSANYTFSDVCFRNNMDFTGTSTVSSGTLTYNWNFSTGTATVQNPVYLYAYPGVYNVRLITTTNNGCIDSITKAVEIYPLPLVDFINTPVCDGLPSSFTQAVTIGTGSITSYAWDFGDGASSTSSVTSHQYLNPGTYSVKLTSISSMGCIHDTTKSVIVNPLPVANFTPTNACVGASNTFVNTSTILGATPLNYLWSFGDGATSILTSPGHMYSTSGTYTVKVVATSGKGCLDSISKTTLTYALPIVSAGRDTSISKGDEVTLNGYSIAGVSYLWTPTTFISNTTIPNPVVRPEETTTYTVLLTDQNGCKNSNVVTVTIIDDYKLLIYNVVTPDGDGKNDYWKIVNIDLYPDATVQIFDRTGIMVYEKTGYQNDWQGTYKNDQLPDGTYYYIVSFVNVSKTTNYKGSITLLRNK
jgi:gliding motility-associated-like protein